MRMIAFSMVCASVNTFVQDVYSLSPFMIMGPGISQTNLSLFLGLNLALGDKLAGVKFVKLAPGHKCLFSKRPIPNYNSN